MSLRSSRPPRPPLVEGRNGSTVARPDRPLRPGPGVLLVVADVGAEACPFGKVPVPFPVLMDLGEDLGGKLGAAGADFGISSGGVSSISMASPSPSVVASSAKAWCFVFDLSDWLVFAVPSCTTEGFRAGLGLLVAAEARFGDVSLVGNAQLGSLNVSAQCSGANLVACDVGGAPTGNAVCALGGGPGGGGGISEGGGCENGEMGGGGCDCPEIGFLDVAVR